MLSFPPLSPDALTAGAGVLDAAGVAGVVEGVLADVDGGEPDGAAGLFPPLAGG